MNLALIPQPKRIEPRDGVFDLAVPSLRIVFTNHDECVWTAVERLTAEIGQATGKAPDVAPGEQGEDYPEILLRSGADPDAEGYTLSIGSGKIIIQGQGSAGIFYGIQTLRQMIRSAGSRLPCCVITDEPHFALRGFYHDVTRGKVPTLATLKSLADTLAYYKINQLQLYVEHTFAFNGLPELWHDKDPLTADEIRELDAYCRQRRIDLVPSLATFGHLYELLRLKRFEHLNELDIRASELPFSLWDRMAHYTIDVSQEESFLLIRSMLDEYLPLFSSRHANICCDETFDLGKGKNRDRAAAYGIGRLYASFVTRLCDVVRSHGKTPMLWGDIVLHHPDVLGEFQADTLFLNWAYGADVTPEATETFLRAGVRQVVCPGVLGWSRFASDVVSASSNIRRMVAYGKSYGAVGVLTTDWGDCGHVNFLPSSYHGMALGAALSWNPDYYGDDASFDRAVAFMQWGDGSGEISALLRELGSLCFFHFGNLYALVNHLDCLWNREEELRLMDPALLAHNHARATAIAERLGRLSAEPEFAAAAQDMREFIWSAEAVTWTLGLLGWIKRERYAQRECPAVYGSVDRLVTKGVILQREFCTLWKARNKTAELRNVVDTFDKLLKMIV